MQSMSARNAWTMLAVVVFAATFQSSTSANHSWGGYHWARTANPFTVKLGDNVSGVDWDARLAEAASDWSTSPTQYLHVLNATVVAGGTNPKSCRATVGQVEVCNSTYGNTGWLGVAQIWITGGAHITQGTVRLNDSYFRTPQYNSQAWRQLVACQEIGHTFGLDHQDENFANANLGTCMDYTNDPSTNQHPNDHDYEELAIIYGGHTDPTTTLKNSPSVSGQVLEAPSQWGQLMRTTRGGRSQVFERDFGNGERVVTFVIWA